MSGVLAGAGFHNPSLYALTSDPTDTQRPPTTPVPLPSVVTPRGAAPHDPRPDSGGTWLSSLS